MIKLFGWESKAETRIDAARREELELVKQKRLWGLINSNLKYVLILDGPVGIASINPGAVVSSLQLHPTDACIDRRLLSLHGGYEA